MSRRIALVGLCGLVLTACGAGKMSANETAAELDRTYPGPNWRCIKGKNGWDYFCGKAGLTDDQVRRHSIGVNVDSDSVTERTAP
jgi:hypothetical protein